MKPDNDIYSKFTRDVARYDRYAQDGQPRSPHSLYPPMRRRPQPVIVHWPAVILGALVLLAIFFVAATVLMGVR